MLFYKRREIIPRQKDIENLWEPNVISGPKAKTFDAEACGCDQNTWVCIRQLSLQPGHFSELQNVDEMHPGCGSVAKVRERSGTFTDYESMVQYPLNSKKDRFHLC